MVGRSFDEDTRAAQANLALICERRAHTTGDGGVKIGVGRTIAGLSIDQVRLKRSRIAYLHAPTKLESAMNFEVVRVSFAEADKPIAPAKIFALDKI